MDTIFTNCGNSKSSDPHRLLLNLSAKINLKRIDEDVSLSNLSIYYPWKNMKNLYIKNEFKISAPTWNKEFGLRDGLYSAADIHAYFKYILKNMRQLYRDGILSGTFTA